MSSISRRPVAAWWSRARRQRVGQPGRRLVERDDLAVWMAERGAGGLAVVAEGDDGRPVGAERAGPVAQRVQDGAHLVFARLLEVPVVPRRLDDHLVVAGVGRHGRELVRHDPDLPVGCARRHPHPLGWREVLVARAERADRRGRRVALGVVGPQRPVGRDQPPAAGLRIDPGLDRHPHNVGVDRPAPWQRAVSATPTRRSGRWREAAAGRIERLY